MLDIPEFLDSVLALLYFARASSAHLLHMFDSTEASAR